MYPHQDSTLADHLRQANESGESIWDREIHDVSPPEAENILVTRRFPGQRRLRPRWVDRLSLDMQRETWLPEEELLFARFEGQLYLIEGQHRLAAVMTSGRSQRFIFKIMTVSSWHAMQELYNIAGLNLPRTESERIEALDLPTRYGFTKTQTDQLNAAMKPLLSGFTLWGGKPPHIYTWLWPYLHDIETKKRLIEVFASDAHSVFADLRGPTPALKDCLKRTVVVALALVTYRYTGSDATEFWQTIAQDDPPTREHPSRLIVHFLLSTPTRKYKPAHYVRYLIAGWNAYYEERMIKTLQSGSLDRPVHIAGTPYDGNHVLFHVRQTGEVLEQPQMVPDLPGETPQDSPHA